MPRSNSRGGRNNNPSGRNQYSDWGVMELARERPIAAAAAAAGAAAAGLFLWSSRSQISHQLSNLSDQIGEWTREHDLGGGRFGRRHRRVRRHVGSQLDGSSRGMSETGGGNASLGRSSGGGDRPARQAAAAAQAAPTSSSKQYRGAPPGAPFHAVRNLRDRLAKLRLGDRAHVRAGTLLERRVRQHAASSSAEPLSSSSLPHTTSVGMVNAFEPVHERVLEALEQLRGGDPIDLLALHELDRQPVRVAALDAVEQLDRVEEEGLAPLPVAKPFEPRAAEHRAARPKALADRLDRRARAEREAAEIEIGRARAVRSARAGRERGFRVG